MADLVLDDVSRIYPDGSAAVSHLSLRVADGEVVAVVGPSGSGKSTMLRLIAGLEPLGGGSISIGGTVVDHVPTARRDVAMVFESGALYPHLTAHENARHPLKIRGLPDEVIEPRVGAMSRVLGLGRFLDRKPATLSAGQRQRVAVARATVREPALFLLDEPLTHVDASERLRLRAELGELLRRLRATAVYVTHDQAQAMAIGDRVAVMRAGRIEQVDRPMGLYHRPANVFVASFIGEPAMTLLAGWIEADAEGAWVVLGNQRLPLPDPAEALIIRAGTPVTVGIRPEHVTEAGTVDDPAAVVFGTASTVQHLGSHVLVSCPMSTSAVAVADGVPTERPGEAALLARLPGRSRVRAGERVELAVDMTALSYFDPVTGEAVWNPA